MYVLGLSGGLDPGNDSSYLLREWQRHDSAAVLLRDGCLVAGIEEEKLNRVKHSGAFPLRAIEFCLQTAGIKLSDVDCVAYYNREESWNEQLAASPGHDGKSVRAIISGLLGGAFGNDVSERLSFVSHHLCHAMTAFAMSGFKESLAITLDAEGDDSNSGAVHEIKSGTIRQLATIPAECSLGLFYLRNIKLAGFDLFEEYKVMGLAPYGDRERGLREFRKIYRRLPEGQWEYTSRRCSHWELPRVREGSMPQEVMDFAAGLQAALEDILSHMLLHFQGVTGHEVLCAAGGVTLNCAAIGKVLASGLFKRVLVAPVAHDAGCAWGAALHETMTRQEQPRIEPPSHVYCGENIGADSAIHHRLMDWSPMLQIEKLDDVIHKTAVLLSEGEVVGWAQGRAEFGPRALGNRSILADPRPAENKDRINRMIKKREAFRPFAPAVVAEAVDDFFEIPTTMREFAFMTHLLPVKTDRRSLLGAVTHVDGTARIQTVSRSANEKFWKLLRAFGELTGVPILLNTSFNNNREPIVNSIDEVVTCLLTTGLSCAVVGNYLVRRNVFDLEKIDDFEISMSPHIHIVEAQGGSEPPGYAARLEVDYLDRHAPSLPGNLAKALCRIRETTTVARFSRFAAAQGVHKDCLVAELERLWSERVLVIRPAETGNG